MELRMRRNREWIFPFSPFKHENSIRTARGRRPFDFGHHINRIKCAFGLDGMYRLVQIAFMATPIEEVRDNAGRFP